MARREATIFAVSTAPGKAAVAVVRVSGPGVAGAIRALTGLPPGPPRAAQLRPLTAPGSDRLIDRGLVVFFKAPQSFTGEDQAEFQVHGGAAVVAALCGALGGFEGFRPAEPGEFSRRAFEHGKLDLLEAEAIADLVAAETEMQRRQAVRQMEGTLGALYEGWRRTLIEALAFTEAALDFADEELPADLLDKVRTKLGPVIIALECHLDDGGRGERLRAGFEVVILGPPNAGKSSLLNILCGRDAAIVTARAGTTRDIVEVALTLDGYPLLLADTAGLRASADEIEAEGVRRARARAARADLKLIVLDGACWPTYDTTLTDLIDKDSLVVLNKRDLLGERVVPARLRGRPVLSLSCLTGEGLPGLRAALVKAAEQRIGLGEAPALTRTRHRQALMECLAALRRFEGAPAAELGAEDLRLANRALGRITGRVDVEDMLDVIFHSFCIGK